MPPFNYNSSGISLLLSPLAIYLCHSMGKKKKKDFPCPPTFLKYWRSLQYNTMLTPLSEQSIKKNQKQGHGKKCENALS